MKGLLFVIKRYPRVIAFNYGDSRYGYNGLCSESTPRNGDVTLYDTATDSLSQ